MTGMLSSDSCPRIGLGQPGPEFDFWLASLVRAPAGVASGTFWRNDARSLRQR